MRAALHVDDIRYFLLVRTLWPLLWWPHYPCIAAVRCTAPKPWWPGGPTLGNLNRSKPSCTWALSPASPNTWTLPPVTLRRMWCTC